MSTMDSPGHDDITLAAYSKAMREADRRFNDERDRRYSEVKAAEEKALAIKSTSDDKALLLARDIQDLKDEKANNLRTQIDSERGNYVTQEQLTAFLDKVAAQIKPLSDYIVARQGVAEGGTELRSIVQVGISALAVLISVVLAILYIVKK